MSGKHLTEDLLQQFVFEPAACPPEVIAHLTECPECCIAAAGYLRLGKALRDQPAPEFGFDLAAAVMGQLGSRPGEVAMAELGSIRGAAVGIRESWEGTAELGRESQQGTAERGRVSRQVSRLVVPALIAIVAALPTWLFRKTAVLVFSDISGAVACIILASAGVAVLFSCYKYYRRYQQVIQLINQ